MVQDRAVLTAADQQKVILVYWAMPHSMT